MSILLPRRLLLTHPPDVSKVLVEKVPALWMTQWLRIPFVAVPAKAGKGFCMRDPDSIDVFLFSTEEKPIGFGRVEVLPVLVRPQFRERIIARAVRNVEVQAVHHLSNDRLWVTTAGVDVEEFKAHLGLLFQIDLGKLIRRSSQL
jgi:hypothetical protein